jgi:hypothetical protein
VLDIKQRNRSIRYIASDTGFYVEKLTPTFKVSAGSKIKPYSIPERFCDESI